jgi:hypothetical protein
MIVFGRKIGYTLTWQPAQAFMKVCIQERPPDPDDVAGETILYPLFLSGSMYCMWREAADFGSVALTVLTRPSSPETKTRKAGNEDYCSLVKDATMFE